MRIFLLAAGSCVIEAGPRPVIDGPGAVVRESLGSESSHIHWPISRWKVLV